MGKFFDTSQQYKARIEQSSDLMQALKTYAGYPADDWEHPMQHLGHGISNTHYRIGQLESGLFVASRENTIFKDGRLQKEITEEYAQDLEKANESGKFTSRFGIGVQVHVNDPEGYFGDRYLLLVEDFTQGGIVDFVPGRKADETGTLDGRVVHYDFDQTLHRRKLADKYMHDDAMIHIHSE